jgi:hypothetical protein
MDQARITEVCAIAEVALTEALEPQSGTIIRELDDDQYAELDDAARELRAAELPSLALAVESARDDLRILRAR